MKKVTLLILLGLLFVMNANAEPRHHRGDGDRRPPGAEQKVERMTEKLGLDEEQAAQLVEILTASEMERAALREQHEELIRLDMCALRSSVSEQVHGVLTAEQASELDEMLASREAHHMERANRHGEERGGRHGKGPRHSIDCDELEAEAS